MTNADKFRAMSDEELASMMARFCMHYDAYHDEDRYYLPRNPATTWTNSKKDAIIEWLKWFQQKEEDT